MKPRHEKNSKAPEIVLHGGSLIEIAHGQAGENQIGQSPKALAAVYAGTSDQVAERSAIRGKCEDKTGQRLAKKTDQVPPPQRSDAR